jgi:hypothetical protein
MYSKTTAILMLLGSCCGNLLPNNSSSDGTTSVSVYREGTSLIQEEGITTLSCYGVAVLLQLIFWFMAPWNRPTVVILVILFNIAMFIPLCVMGDDALVSLVTAVLFVFAVFGQLAGSFLYHRYEILKAIEQDEAKTKVSKQEEIVKEFVEFKDKLRTSDEIMNFSVLFNQHLQKNMASKGGAKIADETKNFSDVSDLTSLTRVVRDEEDLARVIKEMRKYLKSLKAIEQKAKDMEIKDSKF